MFFFLFIILKPVYITSNKHNDYNIGIRVNSDILSCLSPINIRSTFTYNNLQGKTHTHTHTNNIPTHT